jgi:hypothetical protein
MMLGKSLEEFDDSDEEIPDELKGMLEMPDNPLLQEVIERYDCEDLLPLAHRVIWLSSLKEACGCIPNDIDVDYAEYRLLVVLGEEQSKKMAYENYKMRRENQKNTNLSDYTSS